MEALQLPGGVEAVVWLRGEDTGGALTMLTDAAPPGWRLPPHRHGRESETIHVTAGRLWMTVDGERIELGPGDTIHIAPGVRHEGGTAGTEPVERIVVFAPAGMEAFFEEIAVTGDPSALLDAAVRHGWDFA
jgi:quercetin dioxygenase-like cupin family protein